MLTLKKVAVTGGLASGKSTVTSVFHKLGAFIVSADQIVHHFLSKESPLSKQVVALLGTEILAGVSIDKKKVAERVFNDADLLHKLEALIHPYVAQEIAKSWQDVKESQKYPLFVAEVPLLFEAHQEPFYDVVVAVTSPLALCIKRFCDSTGYGKEEYMRRASFQLKPAVKAKRANFIIENQGSLKALEEKATSLFYLLSRGENS